MEFERDEHSWDVKAEKWDARIGEDGDFTRKYMTDRYLWTYLGDVNGLSVLDAGCGTGYFSRQLRRKGATVVGIDYSSKMIEIAKQQAEKAILAIDHHVDTSTSLGTITDNSMDKIVSNFVLMDLDDLEGAVRSFARVLKEGGEVVVAMTHPCFPDPVQSDDPNNPYPVYKWEHSYFEETKVIIPAWAEFETSFIGYNRPLSQYFQTFNKHGFKLLDLDEPRLQQEVEGMDDGRIFRGKYWSWSVVFHWKLKQ